MMMTAGMGFPQDRTESMYVCGVRMDVSAFPFCEHSVIGSGHSTLLEPWDSFALDLSIVLL